MHTPLHGVGRDVLVAALVKAGFTAPYVVVSQGDPDPDFPTVAFPNPEEPGAIDAALDAARERDADIVLANDPDADRCAVAVPDADGRRRLADAARRRGRRPARRAPDRPRRPAGAVFANSIVSSRWLAAICAAAGIRHEETLTGFKWISRVPGLRYGYEEALGYCVDPAHVRDKDGVSAALLMAELAATLKAQGRTLLDRLDELARAPRALPDRPAVDAGRRPGPDRRRDEPAARAPAHDAGRQRGRAAGRPRAPDERPAADRRPALPDGRRLAGHRAAERHRAQAQVLPRGRSCRRTGRAGRRGGGPAYGRGCPGPAAGRRGGSAGDRPERRLRRSCPPSGLPTRRVGRVTVSASVSPVGPGPRGRRHQ